MRLKSGLLLAGIAIVAIAASAYWKLHQPTGSGSPAPVAMVTPVGITIQTLGAPPADGIYDVIVVDFLRGTLTQSAFADANGMPLYTYDKDTEAGKSTCNDQCIKAWPAVLAPPDAKPFGDWSIIARDDGGKQWAFKGKPLYTFVKDTVPAVATGVAPAGGKADAQPPSPWHVAKFQPNESSGVPFSIAVQEVSDANVQALVDNRGMTLYQFDGTADQDKEKCAAARCPSHWIPAAAALLANAAGDFSLITRDDGVRQWAYKGKPLYTFEGDTVAGDANGAGVDHRSVAVVRRYFMPDSARIQQTPSNGKVLATADGHTLYRRNSYIFQVSGHALAHGVLNIPSMGRLIGTKGCASECLKSWRPLTAAPDARSSGYWEVMTREDGTKQWAYKGYALYTYAADKNPGDVFGDDQFDIYANNDIHRVSDDGALVATEVRAQNQTGLYWSHMYP